MKNPQKVICRICRCAGSLLFALALTLVSCQDERMAKDVALGSDAVTFHVVLDDSSMTTRSEEPVAVENTLISVPGIEDSLALSVSINEITTPMLSLPEKAVTRGEPVTTDNLGALYSTFVVNAKEVPNSDYFSFSMNNVDVSYDSSRTPEWNTATTYIWPQKEAHDVDFWFYSPKALTGYEGSRSTPLVDFTNGNVSFDYEMAYNKTESDNPVDAVKQPDLLFAHQTWNREKGPVEVHFYHALSAIRFVAGVVEDCTINSITLTDVVTDASCVFSPATSSADMFQWTLSSNPADVHDISQAFNVRLTSNDDTTVRQDVTDADGHVERTFMVIPQNFEQIKVTLSYSVNGLREYSTDLTLPSFENTQTEHPDEWLPGKMYTYVINNVGGEELYIEVEDDVEGWVKKDLRISNTAESNVKCYIRAAILGNWYKEGNIVSPWSTSNGSFDSTFPTQVGVTTNNWTLASDGYYYYKYPVYPGMLTGQTDTDPDGDPLFLQYTAPSQPAVAGAQLNVQVVAQGIQWDADKSNVTEAWGTEISGYLSASDKE